MIRLLCFVIIFNFLSCTTPTSYFKPTEQFKKDTNLVTAVKICFDNKIQNPTQKMPLRVILPFYRCLEEAIQKSEMVRESEGFVLLFSDISRMKLNHKLDDSIIDGFVFNENMNQIEKFLLKNDCDLQNEILIAQNFKGFYQFFKSQCTR
jgi:hypothetical protein